MRPPRSVIRTAKVTYEKRELSREFRRAPTVAERQAWALLRNRRCLGLKFRRQQVVRGFILDFYCHALSLSIEIDGDVHDDAECLAYDIERARMLMEFGIRELRVRNDEVNAETFARLIGALLHVPPSPSVRTRASSAPGGGGPGG